MELLVLFIFTVAIIFIVANSVKNAQRRREYYEEKEALRRGEEFRKRRDAILNPAYEPIFFSRKQILDLPVRIIGVVTEIRRKVRK